MRWQDTAREQHGVIAHRQLIAAGLSDGQIDTLRRRGDLMRFVDRRGIWRARACTATPLTGPWAAALASGAVISHRSAAAVHGYCQPPTGMVHVTVGDRSRIRIAPGIRVHRVPLADEDVAVVRGLRVAIGERAILECLRTEPLRDGRDLLDRALVEKWITEHDLDRELEESGGRWGSAKLRRLRVECSQGDSISERKLHSLLRGARIRGWTANAPVDVGFAILKFDVVFPRLKLILEVDGWRTHTEKARFQTDRTRQNAVVERGWRVLRFTWFDVTERPDYVLNRVRRAIAQQP
jgi:very-short-patch-repair endonuclease